MDYNDRIYIAGHTGLIGTSLVNSLLKQGYNDLIYENHNNLNLLASDDVERFLNKAKPDVVLFAAGSVGGIEANIKFPATYIYENSLMQLNIIEQSMRANINQLLLISSSCSYPANIQRPIREDDLLTAKPEKTNEAYAISKILGVKICEAYNKQYPGRSLDYRCVISANAYGFNDKFNTTHNHVIPALIEKIHHSKVNDLKSILVWGSGSPIRDFLFADDIASACIHIMGINKDRFFSIAKNNLINIGSGKGITISDLVDNIKKIIGYKGNIDYDLSKPDGMPMKVLNTELISQLGWKPTISLEEGIRLTYNNYLLTNKNK